MVFEKQFDENIKIRMNKSLFFMVFSRFFLDLLTALGIEAKMSAANCNGKPDSTECWNAHVTLQAQLLLILGGERLFVPCVFG